MRTAAISFELIARAKEAFPADRANIVAKNAVTSKGIRAAARVPEAVSMMGVPACWSSVACEQVLSVYAAMSGPFVASAPKGTGACRVRSLQLLQA